MALRSMTGYGRAQGEGAGLVFSVEVRSVNHRGLDVKVNTPHWLSAVEARVLGAIRSHVRRGRVALRVDVEPSERADSAGPIDVEQAKRYKAHLEALREALGLDDPVRLDHILANSELFRQPDRWVDPEVAWEVLEPCVGEALTRLNAARDREGEALAADFDARLERIERWVTSNEGAVGETVQHYRERLKARLDEALEAMQVPELAQERLLQEVVIFADRCDITEELTRSKAHVVALRRLIASHAPATDGAIGKKLDFYLQELIRETNTTGSKSQSATIAANVIDIRSEIDRMREQVLNVE